MLLSNFKFDQSVRCFEKCPYCGTATLNFSDHSIAHKNDLMQLEAGIVLCGQWPQHSEVTERILVARDRYILLQVKATAL